MKKLSEDTQPVKAIPSDSEVKAEKDFQQLISDYSYYNEHIVNYCLGRENNFLQQSFQEFNRIEVDLSDPSLFAEKLEVMQHLKRTQIITSQVKASNPKDQVSLISRAPDQTSLRSYNPLFKNQSDIASSSYTPYDVGQNLSGDMQSDYSDKEDQFELDYSNNANITQQPPLLPLTNVCTHITYNV